MKKGTMMGFALGMMSSGAITYLMLNKNKMKVKKVMNNLMNKAEEFTDNMTK